MARVKGPLPMSQAGNSSNSGPKQTAIYITGLPEDVTVDELHQHFSKVGVIMDDMFTNGPRIKLYEDEQGALKGDALLVYLCEPSVKLAIDILDESQLRPGVVVRVHPASFNKQPTEESDKRKYDDALAEQPEAKALKVDKETWKRHMREMKRKIAWDADEEEGVIIEDYKGGAAQKTKQDQWSRVAVLRHMFTAKELEDDPKAILDIKEDIMEEAEKLGPVVNVHLYDQFDDGRCAVKFKTASAASKCVALFDGRYFSGRIVQAEIYDGSFRLREAKRKDAETENEEERLAKFSEWLENAGSSDDE